VARSRKTPAASSRLIPRVLRLLRARGVDVDGLVRRLRLPRDAERADELPTTPDDFEALIAAAARALGDPLLAVRLPELLEWPSYHVGELAARSAPTLREAFARVVRYAPLFYAHLAIACEERDGELVVTHRLRAGGPGGRFGNEYALAAMLAHARRLCGSSLLPRRVFFSHHQTRGVEALRAHFGTDDVGFDRAESGVAFAIEDGARPSLARDPRLLATAETLAERALAESPPAHDFVAAVESKLRASLPEGGVDAAAVAKKLRMSTRTLQRRLDEAGTSFSTLLERARKDLAVQAVRARLPLAEAALRAGFSDAATFSRAFKRWTGRTPGEYRKTLSWRSHELE
jgi:AraC-like DNA-binding protein